jgi:hypothetical protein
MNGYLVYLLEDVERYEGSYVYGVFSSKEKAEEAATHVQFSGDKVITEYIVDEIRT